MSLLPAEAPSRAAFLEFPARAYLEEYYGAVGEENAAMLRAILAGLPRPEAVGPCVIEVGGGPSLFSLMAIAARRRRPFERVTFTDIAAANLTEVRWWLDDDPRQFDYLELLSWLEAEVGADPLAVTESLRASPWELVPIDWLASDAPYWHGAFDVVSSHFLAESATEDRAELLDLLGKVGRLGRHGAAVLLSFVCRSHCYRVNGQEFPVFALDEDSVLELLADAGVSLANPQVRAAPTEDPNSQRGYEGMVFVAGRLICG
jgi:NNMT/PNMT/TEMT family